MQCRNCGTEIADKAIVCYRCGSAPPIRCASRLPLQSRAARLPLVAAGAAVDPGAGRSVAGAERVRYPREFEMAAGRVLAPVRRRCMLHRSPRRGAADVYTLRHARRPPRSHRRARPAHRPDRESRRSRSAAARPTICGWPAAKCRAITPKSRSTSSTSSCAIAARATAPTSTASRSPSSTLAHGDRIRLGRSGGAEMVFLLADTRADAGRSRPTTTAIGDLRQIAALLEGLRALGSGRVLDDVLSLVLDSAIEVSGAERGFIMLAAPSSELEFKMARGTRPHRRCPAAASRPAARFPRKSSAPASRSIVADLLDGELANVHMGTVALGIRNVLCVPLRLVRYLDQAEAVGERERRIGVLYLDSREKGTLLSSSTRARARDAGDRGRRRDRERPALSRDDGEGADGAGDADRGGDPAGAAAQGRPRRARSSAPPRRRCRADRSAATSTTTSTCRPARSGSRSATSPAKGPPAALLSAMMQGIFAAQAASSDSPSQTISRVNLALYRRGIESRFVTLMYGALDPGRPPDVLQRRAQPAAAWSGSDRRPPARMRRADRRAVRARDLRGGDRHADRRRLADRVQRRRVRGDVGAAATSTARTRILDVRRSATTSWSRAQLLEALFADVRDFTRGAPQSDDITAHGPEVPVIRLVEPLRRRQRVAAGVWIVPRGRVWNGIFEMMVVRGVEGVLWSAPRCTMRAARPFTPIARRHGPRDLSRDAGSRRCGPRSSFSPRWSTVSRLCRSARRLPDRPVTPVPARSWLR